MVCIKSHSDPLCALRKGLIYIIMDINKCECGVISFNVGIINARTSIVCFCGESAETSIWWISSELFRPIQYNSATEELANKEIIEEKSDIPIKEPQKEKA